ncbi:MAG: MATE family efflux transporter [Eubacterium sp.]|nr:MATE family efflux transporter [Eubacterium sp.]MBR1674387.1 MATE family efflux transporter [Eubacterium sp.]
MEDKKIIDFTQGNPAKHIIRFYIPLFFTSLLQQVYNFVDVLIVGKGLGDDAFASVGNMSSLFFLIVGFSFGLANGFGVLIAQSFGAKKVEELRHRIAGTIQLAVVMAVFLTTISIIFLPNALRLLRTDEKLMANCLKYGYIIFGGLVTSIAYNISAAILRALGDSRTPLRAIITSSVINLALDSLFIFGLGMGVEGAAIATIISQIISATVCIRRIRQIEMIKLHREDFQNEKKVYIELFRNGLPNAFMNSITAVGCMVVQYFINGYGVAYTTAYSACSKYLNLFMNPASTAGNAMSAYTSQNYGAREYGRIKDGLKVCLSIALVAYLVLGSVMVFMPEFLARILLKGDEAVRLACSFIPVCGVSIIAVDFLFVFRSGVQGMGYPVIPMWSGALEMVLRIAVITLFMDKIGITAAAFAETSAWIGALIMNSTAFFKILLPKLREDENIFFKRKRRASV